MLSEVMPFHEQHEEGVEFLMLVDYTQEISWISLSEYL